MLNNHFKVIVLGLMLLTVSAPAHGRMPSITTSTIASQNTNIQELMEAQLKGLAAIEEAAKNANNLFYKPKDGLVKSKEASATRDGDSDCLPQFAVCNLINNQCCSGICVPLSFLIGVCAGPENSA